MAAAASTTASETTTAVTDSTSGSGGGDWDEEALAAAFARKGAVAGNATELLDMKALESKRREHDDVAERLRVEETKAKIAAAREGMEREAQRLKEEREKKDEAMKPETPAAGLGGVGGKYVPRHMRAGVGGLSRMRMGAAGMPSQRLDTQDESLFPDLASADKILEKQKNQVAYKVPKKTAVGGGATWGSRPAVPKQPAKAVVKEAIPPKVEPSVDPPKAKASETPKAQSDNVSPASEAATSAVVPKKKKKKKKDLSTFKPS